MTFQQALQAMQDGHAVRRPRFPAGYLCSDVRGVIRFMGPGVFEWEIKDFTATDWTVFEPNKRSRSAEILSFWFRA